MTNARELLRKAAIDMNMPSYAECIDAGDLDQHDLAALAAIEAALPKWLPIGEDTPRDRPILCRYMWQGKHRFMVLRRSLLGPWWIRDGTNQVVHNDNARLGSMEETTNLCPTHYMTFESLPSPPDKG